jgi:hypothetical protein
MHVTMARKGLGSFLKVSKSKIHSPEVGSSFVKNIGSYCQHWHVIGHHTRECPLPNIPLPTIPKNSTMYENNHFLLSKVKGQVKVRFIGKLTKNDRKKLPKQLWVPKLSSLMFKAQSLVGSLKLNLDLLMCVGELQSRR